jgi:hypothetical protein
LDQADAASGEGLLQSHLVGQSKGNNDGNCRSNYKPAMPLNQVASDLPVTSPRQ